MTTLCDRVAERYATGAPLTSDEAAHAEACVDCAGLARVPGLLAAVAREPEPAPGFAARVHVGARARLAARRRRRALATGAGAACAAALCLVAVTRPDARVFDAGAMRALADHEPRPRPAPMDDVAAIEPLEDALVRVADVDRVLGDTSWSEVARPLSPYRALLLEVAREGAPR